MKSRRAVFSKVQNIKAMHARKIFLKELNVLGMKFKNQNKNPDPLKAELENVS